MSGADSLVVGMVGPGHVVEREHGALAGLADKINAEIAAAEISAMSAVQHALTAGGLLNEAKGCVQHGEWAAWLETNCRVAPRTARAYMSLAARLPALPDEERQRVADLPLRDAIKAISTAPTAPPSRPSIHRPSRDQRDRATRALSQAADAQRALVRHVGQNYIKRKEVERTRAKLRAALAALDELQVDGECGGPL